MSGRLQHQKGVAHLGNNHPTQRLANQVVMAKKAALGMPLLAGLQLDHGALLVFSNQQDKVAVSRQRLGIGR